MFCDNVSFWNKSCLVCHADALLSKQEKTDMENILTKLHKQIHMYLVWHDRFHILISLHCYFKNTLEHKGWNKKQILSCFYWIEPYTRKGIYTKEKYICLLSQMLPRSNQLKDICFSRYKFCTSWTEILIGVWCKKWQLQKMCWNMKLWKWKKKELKK